MVQVFMVVRCYHCETFQIQQVKENNQCMYVYGLAGSSHCVGQSFNKLLPMNCIAPGEEGEQMDL